MSVPFNDLSRIVRRQPVHILNDWAEILDACDFVGGPRVTTFEADLAKATGVDRAIACANGTDALLVALKAAGVTRGQRVAIPNLTFWATFEAVAQLGATPVLVDIDPDDLQMSLDELRAADRERPLDAVVLVHLYGWTSARLAEIRSFCSSRGIYLVEDAAQAFGVTVGGRSVFTDALISTVSFYPAKVLGGAMDGGAVLTDIARVATYARSLCNHGRAEHYQHAHVGWNSRMSGLQASFLSRALGMRNEIVGQRRAAARWYREHLEGLPSVRVHGPPAGVEENGYLNVLTVEGRSGREIVEALRTCGIEAGRVYPIAVSDQPGVREVDTVSTGELPVSRRFCDAVFNLPLFYGIREDEQQACVDALREVLS